MKESGSIFRTSRSNCSAALKFLVLIAAAARFKDLSDENGSWANSLILRSTNSTAFPVTFMGG
jgi:hypothetical protein